MPLTEHYITLSQQPDGYYFLQGSAETADTFLITELLLPDTFLERQDSRALLKCVVGVLTFFGPCAISSLLLWLLIIIISVEFTYQRQV